jgi:hypothetical protein
LLFGAVGTFQAWRAGERLLLVWLGVVVLLMYAPVPYQRRFALGLQPALAVLAAMGVPLAQRWCAEALVRGRLSAQMASFLGRRLVRYAVLLLAFAPGLLVYLVIVFSAASRNADALYSVDRDTYTLGEWIAQHSGLDTVLLASLNTSNALMGVVPGRVVVGTPGVSLQGRDKLRTIESTYRGDLSEEELRAFLAANRVDYIIVGPEERKLGPSDPGQRLQLPVARRVGDAVAYRVPGA